MATPPDPNATVYDTNRLSKWFAISSIILLVTIIWATVEDFDRPWKEYSRQDHRIQAALAERKLKSAQAAMDKSRLAALDKDIEKITAEVARLVPEADEAIARRSAVYYKKNQVFQFTKANLDALKFEVDLSVEHLSPQAPKLQAKYAALEKEVLKLKNEALRAEEEKTAAIDLKKEILAKKKKDEDDVAAMTRERDRIKKTIEKNEESLLNVARNAPLLDFIAPTVKINQVILANLKDDYFFNKVPRVDRCMSCHSTIDKAGFENYPQPFKTHPKIDLYLSANSPHPVERIGCTVCHSGVPQSVDFALAGHTPDTIAQEEDWEHRYHYHRSPHIPTPMIPLSMTEGKCVQCHARQLELRDAPTFNAGNRLIEQLGCFGCHKFSGAIDELAALKGKPGPQLTNISSKLSESFVKKFIYEPTSYRPSSLMPRFWKNHNNSDADSIARGAVEIDAIVHVLFKKAKPYEPIKMASSIVGDTARGKQIVGSVGCLACHAVSDFPRKNVEDSKALGYKDPRVPMYGPELNQMGSKVSKEWLYSWLTEPKHYWNETRMPSLRLSPQEAADVAEYLLTKRNLEFEALQLPQPDDKVRDKILFDNFRTNLTFEEARTKLASMSLEDRKTWLGEKMINHYGCYGCHAIEGFEKAPKIGAELTTEGSKDISKFTFENLQIPPTSRPEWVYTKIRTPRVFDVGKGRDFESRVRMPQFNINHEQARAIAAIVLGHENQNVDEAAKFPVDERWSQIIRGQAQVHTNNCTGCHAVNGKGAEILAFYQDDITNGPPNLNTQGAKTRPEFLFGFLKQQYPIRPWLKIRMPQFHMADEWASNYTKFFAAMDKEPFPFYMNDHHRLSSSEFDEAGRLFKQQGCLTCHAIRKPGEDVSAAAPHLDNVKLRLKGDWVVRWIKNPNAIMPGTRMPQLWPPLDPDKADSPPTPIPGYFGDDGNRQIEKMRDFLFMYGSSDIPDTVPIPKTPVFVNAPAPEGAETAGSATPKPAAR